MKKNYEKWMSEKRILNNKKTPPPNFRKKDIWIASLGENIGVEEDGKGGSFVRPVLLLKVFNKFLCLIVPLSTTEQRGKFWFPFDGHTGKISVALLSQIRTISTRRLVRLIGKADQNVFEKIIDEIKKVNEL